MSPHTKQFIIQPTRTRLIISESSLDHPNLQINPTETFSPEKTTIAFDLHGVVFQTSKRNVLKAIWKCPHKAALLKLLFNIHFIYDLLSAISRKKVIEQWIYFLAKKYAAFDKIKPTAFEIVESQKPINLTVQMLTKLKTHGYKLVAFSNIGTQSMKALKAQYPAILDLFDVTIYSHKDDGYIAKPSPEAFQKLNDAIGISQNCIFIDDTFTNIQHSYQHGIYGILFMNAFSLKQSFIEIGIL